MAHALPFVADAVSYAAAAVMTTRWKETYRPDRTTQSLVHDVKDGLVYVLQRSWLRSFCLWAAILNLGGISFDVCLNLRLAERGVPSYQIGLVNTLGACTGVVGALLAPRLIERLPTSRITLMTTVLGSASFAASALCDDLWLVALFVAGGMFLFPANNAALGAFMQTHIPQEMQGRTTASTGLLIGALVPFAPLIAGWMLELGFGSWALAVCAGIVLASLVPVLTNPVLRSLPAPAHWEAEAVVSRLG